ncbi:MAG: GNAT family N-acetyltransferase [Kineosporiaceae bacterium]
MTVELDVVPATERDLTQLRTDPDAFARDRGWRLETGWNEFPGALEDSLAMLAEGVPAEWGTQLFVDRAAAVVAGMGGFKGAPHDGAVEIGYQLAPTYRGRGLATGAVHVMVDRARQVGVHLVRAHTLPGPNPSTAVLERVGFRHASTVEDPGDGPVWRWELDLGTDVT